MTNLETADLADAEGKQSSLQADIQQDLNDVRGLLEYSGPESEVKKYRKAAEIILLKALHRDPENEQAKALLRYTRGLPISPETPPAQRQSASQAKPTPAQRA